MQRRDISIVWIHTLLTPSYAFEQFKAILEENTLILHCKTTCCYRTTLPSTPTTLEAPTTCRPSSNQDRFRVKKGRQTVFFTAVNPKHTHLHKQRDYDVTKPRIAVYKQNGKYTRISVLGQFESCSEEGIDVPSNEIYRDHPTQHSTSSVY